MLIVSDSTNRRVYKIQRGRDKRFGTRDDIVKSFGTHKYGSRRLRTLPSGASTYSSSAVARRSSSRPH